MHYFLSIEVIRKKDKPKLSQHKYTLNLLKEIGMLDSKSTETPMDSSLKPKIDEGELFEDYTRYKRLIGTLIYLTLTWPDISFTVNVLS